ncbi:hypothetical protein [Agrococcus sp. DT81.2]|uniref:hypothetical protein n=1 Tax=Agrococcus sp. DT81.2 TaxID=3393414 RepID=UPI003CE45FBB
MSAERASAAVRQAREDDFSDGLRLGSLEMAQAVEAPGVRIGGAGTALLTLATGLALVAPLGGVLAPLGGSGADVFSGTGRLAPDQERLIVLACFWIAAAGQAWSLFSWWRLGRARSGWAVAAAALAVAAAAVAALWHLARTPDPTAFLLPILLTGALGLMALVARLTMSRRETAADVRRRQVAEQLRTLPSEQQHALLAERREILAALLDRGLIDDELAQRAAAAPLGEWWQVDRERPSGE